LVTFLHERFTKLEIIYKDDSPPLINFNSPIPNIGHGAFLLALLVSLLPSSNENILVQEVVPGNWLWDWLMPVQTDCPFTQWKNFYQI
jgi:hypothetical protein